MAASAVLQILIQAKDEASAELKQIGEEVKRQKKEFSDQAAALRSIGTALTAVGAPITAFAALSVRSYTQTGEALLKLGAQTGMTVENLSALKFAAESNGETIEGLAAAFGFAQRVMEEAARGTDTAERAISQLGLSVEELRRLSPDQQFEAMADGIAAIEDPAARTAAATGIFGRSAQGLIPVLKDGAAGLAEFRARAQDAGAVMSTEAAEGAAQLGASMQELKASFGAMQQSLAEAIAPALTALVEGLTSVVQAVLRVKEALGPVGDVLATLVVSFGALAVAIGPVLILLPSLIGGIGALTAAVGALNLSLLGPVGIVAALGAVSFALGRAVGNWIVGFQEMEDASERFSDKFTNLTAENVRQIEILDRAFVNGRQVMTLAEAEKQLAWEESAKEQIKNSEILAEIGKEEQRRQERLAVLVEESQARIRAAEEETRRKKEEDALKEAGREALSLEILRDSILQRIELRKQEARAAVLTGQLEEEKATREFADIQARVKGLPAQTPGVGNTVPFTDFDPESPGLKALAELFLRSSAGGPPGFSGAPINVTVQVVMDGKPVSQSVAQVAIDAGVLP